MRIFLLANVELSEQENEFYNTKLYPNENDIIVRFNDARNTKLYNNNCNILFTRHGGDKFNGFMTKVDSTQLCKHDNITDFTNVNVHTIYWHPHPHTKCYDTLNIKLTKEAIIASNKNLKFKQDLYINDYRDLSTDPTTGYIGFRYIFETLFPGADQFLLIGFDFHKRTQFNNELIWKMGTGHNFPVEETYFRKLIKTNSKVVLYEKSDFITNYIHNENNQLIIKK